MYNFMEKKTEIEWMDERSRTKMATAGSYAHRTREKGAQRHTHTHTAKQIERAHVLMIKILYV